MGTGERTENIGRYERGNNETVCCHYCYWGDCSNDLSDTKGVLHVMKAIWVTDYDLTNDKCYKVPGCPECDEPIGLYEDGKYYCYNCRKEVTVHDPEMVEWFRVRNETKVELQDCEVLEDKNGNIICGCGGKNCMEVYYRRNPITLKWQQAFGQCKRCGKRFIV